jgi:hypothetical protein
LRRYRLEVMPRLSLSVDELPKDYCTTVEVRIPALACRQVLSH